MHDIICPNCGQAFKIDETGYADILKQIRDREFENQLKKRLELAEKDKQNALELATQKLKTELHSITAAKDIEIQNLISNLKEKDVSQQLAITEAVAATEKQRDQLANEIKQIRDAATAMAC